MIELGYRYCKLDKIHYYSVVDPGEAPRLYFNQWLWYYIRFEQTKNVSLMPYHANWSQFKILGRYKGNDAKIVAGYISKKIEKHRKLLNL